jgi:hypothetical protein
VDYRNQTTNALLEAEDALLSAHGDLMHSPANEVEGLDRAACSTHISSLARLAMGAADAGVDAEQWRGWVRDALGDERGPAVLRAAEHCMRSNGLWPWAGQGASPSSAPSRAGFGADPARRRREGGLDAGRVADNAARSDAKACAAGASEWGRAPGHSDPAQGRFTARSSPR